MPTVVEVEGYRVAVYTRDEHPPAHVHVHKNDTIIKVILNEGEVEYHSFKGRQPRLREIYRAAEIVSEHLDECWTTWRKYVP